MSGYFYVTTMLVYEQVVEIQAGTYDEAIQLVEAGNGVDLEETFEYSYTLDPEYWKVSVSKPRVE